MRRNAIVLGSTLGVVALAAGAVGLGLLGGEGADRAPLGTDELAGAQQLSFDESAAVITDQDEFSTTLTDPTSGVTRVELSMFPMQVLRDGEWVPIETAVKPAEDGSWSAPLHALQPVFAASADSTSLVSVTTGDYTVTMSLPGASPSGLAVLEDVDMIESPHAVLYEDVLDSADVLFGVTLSGLRTAVVVNDPPTDAHLTYQWRVNAPGLTPVRDEFDDLRFVGADGQTHLTMPIPGMWDSSGKYGDADGAAINIDYDVTEGAGDSFVITLRPDVAWMLDPERVYPLYVDPGTQATIGATGIRGFKSDGYTANDAIRIGDISSDSSCCYWRTVLKHDLSTYSGKRLTGAQLLGQRYYGTTDAQTGGVYEATGFSYGSVGAKLSSHTIDSYGYAIDEGLFTWMSKKLNASDFDDYLMLRGLESSTTYSYKKLDSTLFIWYVNRPKFDSVTGPDYGDPVFVDQIVIDSQGTEYTETGQQMRYKFTSSTGVAWTSGWEPEGPYRIPATALTPGALYTYVVETRDKYAESPIVVNAQPRFYLNTYRGPGAAEQLTVDGASLTQDLTTATDKPVVSATVSHPEGFPVWAMFTVWQDGIVIMDSVPGSKVTRGSGTSQVQLPYAISNNSTYTITVRSFDGHVLSAETVGGYTFTGPPRTVREIPSTDDNDLGATS